MGRKPKRRIDFWHDANYLRVLREAVVEDERMPIRWRKDIAARLQEIAVKLVAAKPADETKSS